MYNVSEAFKKAIKASYRKSTITGTLTTSNGVEYVLDDNEFIKDSFYVSNRCVNGSALEFGCVYAAECGFMLITDIDRYTLFDANIKVQYNLLLEDGTVESLPLGEFCVDNATRQGRLIKITSLDNMIKFDKPIEDDTNGPWLDLVKYVAGKCDVELSQSDEELLALHANTEPSYTLRTDKIETYRDCLAYLAMVVCAFATIDNNGRLKFIQFGSTAVDVNNSSTRLDGCIFDDYKTRYGGVVARFIAEQNYYPYTATKKELKNSLILDMGDIPIVGGVVSIKQRIVDNILDTLSAIEYTPAKLYISSNPALELGDMIQCDNVNGSSTSVNTYVMNYRFEYRKKEALQSYGENPRLQNVKEKNKKLFNNVMQQVEQNKVAVVSYTNAKAYTVKQSNLGIIELNYSTFEECAPIFMATIPFSLDVDGYVEFTLCNALVPIENGVYKGYYAAGNHFATIMCVLSNKKDDIELLSVLCKTYADVNSEIRKINANIESLKNAFNLLKSNTEEGVEIEIEDVELSLKEPTCSIEAEQIKAAVFAQGVNTGTAPWDGTLEFTDSFGSVSVNSVGVLPFEGSVGTEFIDPMRNGFVDNFASISIASVGVALFDASPVFDKVIKGWEMSTTYKHLCEYNDRYIDVSNAEFKMNNNYSYSSSDVSIDSGFVQELVLNLDEFNTIESLVIDYV